MTSAVTARPSDLAARIISTEPAVDRCKKCMRHPSGARGRGRAPASSPRRGRAGRRCRDGSRRRPRSCGRPRRAVRPRSARRARRRARRRTRGARRIKPAVLHAPAVVGEQAHAELGHLPHGGEVLATPADSDRPGDGDLGHRLVRRGRARRARRPHSRWQAWCSAWRRPPCSRRGRRPASRTRPSRRSRRRARAGARAGRRGPARRCSRRPRAASRPCGTSIVSSTATMRPSSMRTSARRSPVSSTTRPAPDDDLVRCLAVSNALAVSGALVARLFIGPPPSPSRWKRTAIRTRTPFLTWRVIERRRQVGDIRGDLDASDHRPGMHDEGVFSERAPPSPG